MAFQQSFPGYVTKSSFHRRAVWLLAILHLLSVSRVTRAQTDERIGVVWTGERGKRESVRDIMARDARDSRPRTSRMKRRPKAPERKDDLNSPKISQWPPKKTNAKEGSPFPEAVRMDTPLVSALSQNVSTNVVAATLSDSGYIPPSSMGAVGPTQILVVVNGTIRTFTKSGVADGAIDTTTDNFFSSVRSSYTSDPRVVFDRLSQCWFVTMMDTIVPNRILIAVSSGTTISDTTSFTFFQFQQDLVGPTPNSDTGLFADQPSLGVDNNALYIGVNILDTTNTTYKSSTGFVVNKADLLGGTLTVTAFRRIATTSAGPYTPLGVTNMDPSWAEGYFIGIDTAFYSTLRICRISNPGGTPWISSKPCTDLTIGSTSSPPLPLTTNAISVPAQGSTPLPLDAIDDRLMNAQMINGSLWATHSIQVDATGTASSTGGRDGMRFYQITNMATTPTLVQAGTLFDASATDPLSFFVGSIATSGQGHSILASSYAGNTAYAGVAFDGRLSGDAPGTLNPTVVFNAGAGAYNVETSSSRGVQRWGDYSNTFVDPTDNMTMWTFQEFTYATDSWGVLVTQLTAPPPATPSTASPSSAPAGTTSNVTIIGSSTGGSGFYDPGSGFPNHISATVNGGGITVNSITYTDPTHIMLNVTIAPGAAQTARTVTVTNPDRKSATSASAIFTVTGPELITLSHCSGLATCRRSAAVLFTSIHDAEQ